MEAARQWLGGACVQVRLFVSGRAEPGRTLLALKEQRLEAALVEESGEEASTLGIGTDQQVLGFPVAGSELLCALRGTPAGGVRMIFKFG